MPKTVHLIWAWENRNKGKDLEEGMQTFGDNWVSKIVGSTESPCQHREQLSFALKRKAIWLLADSSNNNNRLFFTYKSMFTIFLVYLFNFI